MIAHYDGLGGGAERWTDRHARRLLSLGYRVHLVAGSFAHVPDGAQCHLVRFRPFGDKRLQFATDAEQLLRRLQVDVIHDMGDGWYADLFMPHHGTRAATFAQNTKMARTLLRPFRDVAYWLLPRYRSFRELESRQFDLKRPTTFVAISKLVAQQMHQSFHVPMQRIQVVYNGVDTGRFHPPTGSASRNDVRQELGFTDETVFLLVAHNFKLKGLDAILRASSRLISEGKRIGVVVAGNGRVSHYRRIASSLGCGAVVRFVGNQPDPVPYYHAADVYVQPTFHDPCSLVVLEAMACGLPALTTRYNGVSEIMVDGLHGFVLNDPADDMTLAAHMRHFMDPSARAATSLANRKLAMQFSLERNCHDFVELYRTIRSRANAA